MRNETVLISGAGIAGPTLAFWLKSAELVPTVVEHAPALRAGGYVIDFWGLGYDIAERMDLAGAIERVGYHMRELRIVNNRGARVAGFGTKVFHELTGGRFVTLGRSDLSRLLFDRIKRTTEFIFGDKIVQTREQPHAVEVQFRGGREQRFDLVIGADGLHSTVRKLTFGSRISLKSPLVMWSRHSKSADTGRGMNKCTSFIAIPAGCLGGSRCTTIGHCFCSFSSQSILQRCSTCRRRKRCCARGIGDGKWECPRILDELDRTQDLYFDRVSQIRMQRWSKGRIALLGDAAFCASLMAGQGSALAMTAAYVLAGELANASGRHGEAFAKYEEVLRAYIGSKQQGAERFAADFRAEDAMGPILRNQVIRLFAIPGLARLGFGRDITDSLPVARLSLANTCTHGCSAGRLCLQPQKGMNGTQ